MTEDTEKVKERSKPSPKCGLLKFFQYPALLKLELRVVRKSKRVHLQLLAVLIG